jgi:hypothetical protein
LGRAALASLADGRRWYWSSSGRGGHWSSSGRGGQLRSGGGGRRHDGQVVDYLLDPNNSSGVTAGQHALGLVLDVTVQGDGPADAFSLHLAMNGRVLLDVGPNFGGNLPIVRRA